MERGQTVEVTTYGGRKLLRTVILDHGSFIVVCNPDEYKTATKEKREPQGVGFPRKDVKQHP